MRRLLRWLRFGRVERREHLTLITTPVGVYAVEDGYPYLIRGSQELEDRLRPGIEAIAATGASSADLRPVRIKFSLPGTTADHEPPSLYDWEREGL